MKIKLTYIIVQLRIYMFYNILIETEEIFFLMFNVQLFYIRWQFKTEGHDIKFGILATDSENIQTVIMPIKKVACHEFEEIGVIKCKHPGECNLFFHYLSIL